MTAHSSYLDLTSTSPNFSSPEDLCSPPKCIYASIWFAYRIEGKTYGVTQGCCNHWDCPRCGQIRAKTEYARIVHGVHELSATYSQMWFQTITCKGKEMSQGEADTGYLQWTNKLLDSYRARVKSKGGFWAYVQVTERQKRGLPHSHFLTTFYPDKLYITVIEKWKTIKGEKVTVQEEVIRSQWMDKAVERSGLGEQYDLSQVRSEAAASRYVAKYMFKQTAFDSQWPKGWKRVRYSQSFPKLPEIKTEAFVLRTQADWDKLGRLATIVRPADIDVEEYAAYKLYRFDTLVMRARKDAKQNLRYNENSD